jgi:penicillin amidase
MRDPVLRWIVRGLLFVVLASALGAAWIVSGRARGPAVEGRLQVSVLSAEVEVLRDAHGIPYVFARNLPDLIRAQGFVTAQARLFQLEAYRALALGRLAEAIGERGLANDREMRTIGLARNAARHAKLLAPEAREFLRWYAEGVNAYIAGHAGDHPVELKLAGFKASAWSIDDMVAVMHFVNWSQAANYRAEWLMQQLVDKLGPRRAAELFPVNVNPDRKEPAATTAAAPEAMWLGIGVPKGGEGAPRAALVTPAAPVTWGTPAAPVTWGTPAAPAVGSNNWAIAPARAASGAAVVVNDPHLDARVLPGIWFPVGLFTPEVQAVGAALPGTPGILVGRNAHVAFGVTNAYGDSQDLFVERIAPRAPDHYLEGEEPRPFEVIEETIRVKDAEAAGGFREEKLAVRHSRCGPVVGDGQALGAQKDRLLVLRTAAAEVAGGGIGIDRLLVARSAAEVDQAVQQMEVYYFNFVFADKAGTIGHRASGRVPVRAGGQGIVPKPVTAADDWQGYIPPDRMPGTLAPARGWVASANHDNRPDGYAWDYSSFFSPSYRYERIGQVLDAGRGLGTAQQRALMLDVRNLQAPRLRPAILAALHGVGEVADLHAVLAAWDGEDRADAAGPLVYQHLYQRIAYETFADELGEPLAQEYLKSWYTWQGRFDQLAATPGSHWFDDVRTPAVETLPDIVRRAALAVHKDLVARHGADPKAWRWGAEHRIHFDSPLRRKGIGRDWLGRAAAPIDGSGETVMRARFAFMGDHDVEFFGSMRLVADLADDEKVMAVVSGGVVERQFHPHQKDQLDAWFAGELLPWWFSRKAVEANARQRQVLVPT